MSHDHSALWDVSGLLTFFLIFAALVYVRAWFRIRGSAVRLSSVRAVSFISGLFLIWIAVASPIAGFDHDLLTVHMIQHLLLMTLAPPLLWMAEPVLAAGRALPERLVSRVKDGLLRRLSLGRLARVLTKPAFCLAAASTVLIGWHIPGSFAFAMKSQTWHLVQQATFLAAGLLFWWPIVQPWPSSSRSELSLILYLFFATLPCDVLSGFLVFCDRVVYPAYTSSSHLFGFSALGDQQCAAALMWTCVTLVYLVAGAILTIQLLAPQNVYKMALPAGAGLSPNVVQHNAGGA